MSFLLRTKKRSGGGAKPQGGAMPRSSAANFARPSFGRQQQQRTVGGGGGQTQAMLHRPQQLRSKQQQQQSVVNKQQPQQQAEQQQNVISMAEVMADLRILEQQQQESQRQLEMVRMAKQLRMQQHGALEAKLRDFKYQQGQDRAAVQRMHEQLSLAQRFLAVSSQKASNAGDSLRDFDNMLKKALATKRRVLAIRRNNNAKVELLQKKLAILHDLDEKAKEQVTRAKQELDEAEQIEASLRQAMRDHAVRLQSIAEETAECRSTNVRLQQEIDDKLKVEQALKLRGENNKKKAAEDEQKTKQVIQSMDKNAVAHEEACRDKRSVINDEQSKMEKQVDRLRAIEDQILKIQVSEKHIPPTDQPVSRPLKPLDLNRIRVSEQAEAKALEDEEKAKQAVVSANESLRMELAKKEQELNSIKEKAAKDRESLQESHRKEKERRKSIDEFLQKLEDARLQVKEHEQTYAEQKKLTDMRITELQQETDEIRKSILLNKEKLALAQKKTKATDTKIEKCKSLYEAALEEDADAREKLEEEIESLREEYSKLEAEANEIEEQLESSTDAGEAAGEEEYGMTVDEMKEEIAQLLEEYPILCDITYDSSPNQPEKQRVKEDLKPIIDHVEKRMDSARKMRAELQEAARREEEERIRIQEAAEAEKQRKREARESRNKRMGDYSTKEPADDTDDEPEKRKRRKDKKRSISRAKQTSKSLEVESAAKPKDLLSAFTQASVEEDTGVDKIEFNLSASQEKKVRWEDHKAETSITTKAKSTKTFGKAPSISNKTEKRKKFGNFNVFGSSKTSSVDLEKQTKKERSSSKERKDRPIKSSRDMEPADRPIKSTREAASTKNPSSGLAMTDKKASKERSSSKSKKDPSMKQAREEAGSKDAKRGKHSQSLDSRKSKKPVVSSLEVSEQPTFSSVKSSKPEESSSSKKRSKNIDGEKKLRKTDSSGFSSSRHRNYHSDAVGKRNTSNTSKHSSHHSDAVEKRSSNTKSKQSSHHSDVAAENRSSTSKSKHSSNNNRSDNNKSSKKERAVVQTTGISSMERPNKTRRRKKTAAQSAAAASKPKIDAFDKDISYNFL